MMKFVFCILLLVSTVLESSNGRLLRRWNHHHHHDDEDDENIMMMDGENGMEMMMMGSSNGEMMTMMQHHGNHHHHYDENDNGGIMMMGHQEMMDKVMNMGNCQEQVNNGGMVQLSGDDIDEEMTIIVRDTTEKDDELQHQHCPMFVIHKLLQHRHDIRRRVTNTTHGVHTKTYAASVHDHLEDDNENETTNDDTVNAWIKQHVESMMTLVQSGHHRIRNCDGLFHQLFDHARDLSLQCRSDDDTGGVQCQHVLRSDKNDDDENNNDDDDYNCAIGLAQAHAQVVSLFLENGWNELHKDHTDMVPDSCFSN